MTKNQAILWYEIKVDEWNEEAGPIRLEPNQLLSYYLDSTHPNFGWHKAYISRVPIEIRYPVLHILVGVKLAYKDPTFAQSLYFFANSRKAFLDLMLFNLPPQIHKFEGAL